MTQKRKRIKPKPERRSLEEMHRICTELAQRSKHGFPNVMVKSGVTINFPTGEWIGKSNGFWS